MPRTPTFRIARILVRIGLVSLAAVVLLITATALLAPYLVDLSAVRDRVAAELSRRLGAEVTCPAARLAILPLPHLAFDRVRVTVPERIDVEIDSLSLRPQLRPLLSGQLRAAKIKVYAPKVRLRLGRIGGAGESPGPGWGETLPGVGAALQRAGSELAASALAGGRLEIDNGRLELARDGAPPLIAQAIRAAAHIEHGRVAFDAEAASDLWSELSASGAYDPATRSGDARVHVARLRAAAVGAPLEFAGVRVNAPEPSADIDLSVSAQRRLRAQVRCSLPVLDLHRDDRRLVLHEPRLAGSLETDGETTDVRVDELRANDPSGSLSGRLRQTAQETELDAHGSNLNVEQVRRIVTFAAGESGPVRAVFDVLRGGVVPQITVRSRAPGLAGLGSRAALEIGGRLENGQVHVPGVDLDLQHVTGLVSIAGGVLTGTKASAQLGRSKAADGEVRVGLHRDTPDLFVRAPIEADARDVDALLRRLVTTEAFRGGMERVQEVTGTLAGRLSVAGTRTRPEVSAEVASFDLSARVAGISVPVQAAGGTMRYGTDGFAAQGVRLRAGASELGDLSLRVGAGAAVEASAGGSRVVLGEVYPWLAATGALAPSSRNPKSLSGTVRAQALRLTVPAAKPSAVRFELRGAVDELVAEPPGNAPWKKLNSPLSFTGVQAVHEAGSGSSVTAAFSGPQGLKGEIDLRLAADRLDLRRLRLADAQSDASFRLSAGADAADVEFKGRIHRATLAALYGEALPFTGAQGDLRVHLPFAAAEDASMEGTLDATDVVLPAPGGGSLQLPTGHVEARGKSLDLAAKAIVGGTDLSVRGSLSRAGKTLSTDLDVTAGPVRWTDITALLPRRDGGAGDAKAAESPAVTGTVRVSADAFTFGDLTWRPLRAVVKIAPGATTVAVKEATLCGVSTPGTIDVTETGLALAFEAAARDQPVESLVPCLGLKKESASGTFNLTGRLAARGAPAEIARRAEGQFELQMEKGRLYGMGLTARLLSVWAIATGGVRNLPDVNKDGIPYDRIRARSDVKSPSLLIREFTLDGPVAKLSGEGTVNVPLDAAGGSEGARGSVDLTFLVTMLSTAGSAIGKIPVLGTFVEGDLLTVPVRATGPLDDVQVSALSASAVSKELVRKTTRTLKLPYRMIEPIIPGGVKP